MPSSEVAETIRKYKGDRYQVPLPRHLVERIFDAEIWVGRTFAGDIFFSPTKERVVMDDDIIPVYEEGLDPYIVKSIDVPLPDSPGETKLFTTIPKKFVSDEVPLAIQIIPDEKVSIYSEPIEYEDKSTRGLFIERHELHDAEAWHAHIRRFFGNMKKIKIIDTLKNGVKRKQLYAYDIPNYRIDIYVEEAIGLDLVYISNLAKNKLTTTPLGEATRRGKSIKSDILDILNREKRKARDMVDAFIDGGVDTKEELGLVIDLDEHSRNSAAHHLMWNREKDKIQEYFASSNGLS